MHGRQDVGGMDQDLKRGQGIPSEGPELLSLLKQHKLTDEEFSKLRFILERSPTLAELGVFSAMWSEHCSYKSSRLHLRRLPQRGERVVVGPGENAGVVRLWGNLCVAFKMESHNHPSFIDPVQGAATGVGGILRDVFCMGARPFASLNALRFGELSHPKTAWLLNGVIRGIGSYGNCVGIPTVGGSVAFDASYNGNNLVNAMSLGLIREEKIFRGTASGPGNMVVYVGSATGRDGIHGATMASDSFDSGDAKEREAVQVGDPFWEKLLMEATLEALDAGLVVGIQDMGAAGLTSSLFEMADRGGSGLHIDLDQVPVRTGGMAAWELLLSESQERMAMVVKPEHLSRLEEILDKWELEHAVIGRVTTTGRVEAWFAGKLELDVPVAPLATHAPLLDRPRKKRLKNPPSRPQAPAPVFASLCLKGLAQSPADISQLFEQYDHHIGNRTFFGPGSRGASLMWIRGEEADYRQGMPPRLGLSAVAGCCERLTRVDSYRGSLMTVLKAARMISAAGGEPLAVTDCLNYGNPEDPAVMNDFSEGVDGIRDACLFLNVPVVSGNVSFYNETDGQSIAPTPMIGMTGRHEDISHALAAVLPEDSIPEDVSLYLLRGSSDGVFFDGSIYEAEFSGELTGELPDISWDCEKESLEFVRSLGERNLAIACRDLGTGGLALAALKMLGESGAGLKFEATLSLQEMFGNRQSAYLLMVAARQEDILRDAAKSLKSTELCRVAGLTRDGQAVWKREKVKVFGKGKLKVH